MFIVLQFLPEESSQKYIQFITKDIFKQIQLNKSVGFITIRYNIQTKKNEKATCASPPTSQGYYLGFPADPALYFSFFCFFIWLPLTVLLPFCVLLWDFYNLIFISSFFFAGGGHLFWGSGWPSSRRTRHLTRLLCNW